MSVSLPLQQTFKKLSRLLFVIFVFCVSIENSAERFHCHPGVRYASIMRTSQGKNYTVIITTIIIVIYLNTLPLYTCGLNITFVKKKKIKNVIIRRCVFSELYLTVVYR